MGLRSFTLLTGVLGGLLWVVRAVVDRVAARPGVEDALGWAGVALLVIALVGIGAGLAGRGALWLRAVVGICLPTLAWSVLMVLHDAGDTVRVDAAAGAVVALACAIGLSRRPVRRPTRHTAGAHAR